MASTIPGFGHQPLNQCSVDGTAGAVSICDVRRAGPAAVRRTLRPALRRVLPDLLASEREQVDQAEQVAELLRATAVGVPGAVDGVAVAQKDVNGEAAVRAEVGAEPA